LIVEVGVPIVLLIAVVILLVSYINLRQTFRRYAGKQSVTWTWIPAEKAMVGKLKSTGQVRYKDYDRNYNNIYEESLVYSPDGKRITTNYDDNEDGYIERFIVTSVDGNIMSQGEDLNENGVFEHEVVYYSKTAYVEYVDKDDDGIYDVAIEHEGSQTRSLDLRSTLFTGQP
jgi:hypothetical protein